MTREDMADYFARLRAVQAREEAAAAAAARPRPVVHKSQPRGAMRRTNALKH